MPDVVSVEFPDGAASEGTVNIGPPERGQCATCCAWYPVPVEHHHTAAECQANANLVDVEV